MTISATDRQVVDRLFQAMQAGPAGEEDMMRLFHDDAVFIEPFTGVPREHRGLAAIREAFKDSWRSPLPDMRLSVERVDLSGDLVRAEWSCTSPVLPSPMRGHDLFSLAQGKIKRLEIVMTEMPEMGEHS